MAAPQAEVESVFARAVEFKSLERRREYLEQACGDDARLRDRVEALLRAHERAGGFLEQPPQLVVATIDAAGLRTADAADAVPLDFLDDCDRPGCIGRLGPYQVLEAVGRGGMGIVLRAYDAQLSRVVAIKALAPELAANAMAVKRFLREARAAAAVVHEHVVTIHAVEEGHRPPYLVMEYLDGMSLAEKIDSVGALEVTEILRIGVQMARGLAAAHQEGLVHRDIKPANILLENSVERVKITDFGLARAVDDVGFTQTGQIAGTPQYMSPEQAQGVPIDTRSDLFSLGSVLYAMCTARPPFRAETPLAMLRRVTEHTPRSIREVNAEIPSWLEAIVFKLLAKDPAERFQTAEEVADLLGRHLSHLQQPTVAPQPAPVTPPLRERVSAAVSPGRTRAPGKQDAPWRMSWQESRPAAVVAVAALAVVALVVVAILALQAPPPSDPPPAGRPDAATLGGGPGGEAPAPPSASRRSAASAEREAPAPEAEIAEVRHLDFSSASLRMGRTSPDGELLVTLSPEQNLAHLRRVRDGALVHEFEGRYTSAVFLGDGRQLVLGTRNSEEGAANELLVRNTETGAKLRRLGPFAGAVLDLALSPDGRTLATAHGQWWGEYRGRDQSVRIWDLAGGELLHEISDHQDQVTSVAFLPDGQRLVSGSRDGTVRLWDVDTGQKIRPFAGTGTGAFAVAASPDGRYLLAGFGPDQESGIKGGVIDDPDHCLAVLWQTDSGAEVRRFRAHRGCVIDVGFSPDGRRVLTASGGVHVGEPLPDGGAKPARDNSARLWDVETGRQLAIIRCETSLRCAEFSAAGDQLLTVEGQVVRFWRIPSSLRAAERRPAVAGPGRRQLLVSSNRGGDFDLYQIDEQGRSWKNLTSHAAEDTGPACSPDGRQVAFCSSRSGNLDVWVMNSDGSQPRQLTTNAAIDRAPCWSPDGTRLAFVRHVSPVNWDIFVIGADGSGEQRLTDHPAKEADPAWSPDGESIAYSFDADGTRLYVMGADGDDARLLSPRKGAYLYPAYSPDGGTIVYTARSYREEDGLSKEFSLELFAADAADGSDERQLTDLGGMNTFAAFSSDGRRIAFQHRKPNTPRGEAVVYVMNADGTEPRPVSGREAHMGYGGGRPAWRP